MLLTNAMLAAAMQEAVAAGLLKRRSNPAEVKANEQTLRAILLAALSPSVLPITGDNLLIPFYNNFELASQEDVSELKSNTDRAD